MSQNYRHRKSGEIYLVLDIAVMNATNKQAGQPMVLYQNQDEEKFVREHTEFYKKFELVPTVKPEK